MVNILRFKFSDNVMESINQFAKINQLTDRKVYKQEWNKWLELNERIVNEEINRMNKLGYDSVKESVKDKMFKAGRYYFRKKNTNKVETNKVETNKVETNKVETNDTQCSQIVITNTQTKREYIKLTTTMLNMIDNHIKQNINNKNYTPANGHKQFCLNNISMLCQEKNNIEKNNIEKNNIEKNNIDMSNINVFLEKIKKTYKNRHFIINQHHN